MKPGPRGALISKATLWTFSVKLVTQLATGEGHLRLLFCVEVVVNRIHRLGETRDVASRVQHTPGLATGAGLARLEHEEEGIEAGGYCWNGISEDGLAAGGVCGILSAVEEEVCHLIRIGLRHVYVSEFWPEY